MKVVVSDLNTGMDEINLEVGGQEVKVPIQKVSLTELLPQVDFLSLHVPSAKQAIIGAEQFALMKDGAIVVNAARGGVVDEDALMAALDSGKLAHAALDVFINEPNPTERCFIIKRSL